MTLFTVTAPEILKLTHSAVIEASAGTGTTMGPAAVTILRRHFLGDRSPVSLMYHGAPPPTARWFALLPANSSDGTEFRKRLT